MYKDILLPIDLGDSRTWDTELPVAIKLCRDNGAVLHLMTVVPDFGMSIVGSYFPKGFEKQALDAASEKLHEFATKKVPEDINVQHIVAHGTVYEEILDTAQRVGADLIVMGAHGPDLKDYLLGSNADRVTRHAKCSVLVVRGKD
jgi:nucleotide-binding universal stress UspA family protein